MKKPEQFEVGQYVIDINDKLRKITSDDMPDLPYEKIKRLATQDEIVRCATPQELLQIDHDQFMEYLRAARNEFVSKIVKIAPHEGTGKALISTVYLRVSTEDILIAFDQLRNKYDAIKKATIKLSTTGPE